MSYLSVNDYGVIGNRFSSALISRFGSIDWCCLPYLDSPSHFGAFMDQNQGGRFQIMPQGEFRSKQRYLPGSKVLETYFETPLGDATLTDWMPIEPLSNEESSLCRRIEMIHGKINWLLHCTPRFKYGTDPAQAEKHSQGILFRGVASDDLAVLRSKIPIEISLNGTSGNARFTLEAGQVTQFTWSWGRRGSICLSTRHSVQAAQTVQPLQSTLEYWAKTAHRCPPTSCIFGGPWHDTVARSGLILQLLTAPYSGSIAEAIVVTLRGPNPNSRIWCPRYASIREGAFTIQALVNLGYPDEARAHFAWMAEILERDGAEGLQPAYTLDGGKILPEKDLPYLSGHAGSRQFQLDVYGHMIVAASEYYRIFGELPGDLWSKLSDLADYICQAWKRPDYGPWGNSLRPEHFVVSKLFCWAALNHIFWLAQAMKKIPSARWLGERNILHKTICEQGFNADKNSFVRSFGEREIDSSLLWIPLLNFLPMDDPRVQGTLERIQLELSIGVLLKRSKSSPDYQNEENIDLWSTLLFVSCLALTGRVNEASDRLAEICSYASPLGLFGDQADLHREVLPHSFPSASVHFALVNAALYVGWAKGRQIHSAYLLGGPDSQKLDHSTAKQRQAG